MRLLSLVALISLSSVANDLNSCKGCHPIIYSEFEQSMHKKSTIKDDKIHQAVWNKHPLKAKGEYKCRLSATHLKVVIAMVTIVGLPA